MAETKNAALSPTTESRLAALEKSIAELSAVLELRTRKLAEIHADATTARENAVKVAEMLDEVLPLVRKAAPLLDSPMARLAQSPAAGVMGLFTGGRRG
jgi:hypothetical protein